MGPRSLMERAGTVDAMFYAREAGWETMAAVMRHTVAVFIIFVLFAGVIWFAAKAGDPLYVAAGTTATPAAVSPLGHLDTILSLTGDDAKQLSLGNSLQSHQTVLAGRASTPSIAVTVVSVTGHTITGTWGTMTVGPSLAKIPHEHSAVRPSSPRRLSRAQPRLFHCRTTGLSGDVHPGIMVDALGSWTDRPPIAGLTSRDHLAPSSRCGHRAPRHDHDHHGIHARSITIILGSAHLSACWSSCSRVTCSGQPDRRGGEPERRGNIMTARRVTIELPQITGTSVPCPAIP